MNSKLIMNNTKIIVKETESFGKGLFTVEDIRKGEIIADWTGGKIFTAEKCSNLPEEVRDHAIQFEEHKWIDTTGIGHFINHSCEPNCGIKGKLKIIAIRNIKKGEWLTYDYEMTEDSYWKMRCKCGSKNCRSTIGAFKNMPENLRKKYRGYISEWLVEKYNLK